MALNDRSQPVEPLLLKRQQAQELLGISSTRYKELVAQGKLKEIAIGDRGRRIPRSELHRYIDEQLNLRAALSES